MPRCKLKAAVFLKRFLGQEGGCPISGGGKRGILVWTGKSLDAMDKAEIKGGFQVLSQIGR